ncbi:4Fe-4S dicluster domain-containing protein [Robiginitalea sediminis]|uniref:4Fe-4S dicluster domain-containing protein n=1 Tax=Robiginitalea sediminis TaxID=1982593 RepID=UPI000B4B1737|nr:4Fe-4S dicluster domain-containing protein [Robiginitalea sediminis]
MDKKEPDNKRREFLGEGWKLGLAAALGGAALSNLKCTPASGKTETLMTTDGQMVEVDTGQVEEMHHMEPGHNVRKGIPGRKFVMVIDLAKCENALACQRSCNKHHFVTGDNAWLKIYNMQDSPDAPPYWMPTLCMHCDKPACVTVCPVDATFKREDGLVLIDNDRCIGCRFCMAACPYSTRVFNWNEPKQEFEMDIDMVHAMHSPEHAGMPSVKGTVDKCDFCPHQAVKGELPHCVTACPNGVFYFGDKNEDTVTNGDETVRLSELLEKKAGYRLFEDLGTDPSVYYLPPKDRIAPFEEGLESYNEFQSVEKPEEPTAEDAQ